MYRFSLEGYLAYSRCSMNVGSMGGLLRVAFSCTQWEEGLLCSSSLTSCSPLLLTELTLACPWSGHASLLMACPRVESDGLACF